MKINQLILLLPILAACSKSPSRPVATQFAEVTDEAGISSIATWKYGGPTLADFDNDGRYDLVLLNHHDYAAQLFMSSGDQRFAEHDPVMNGEDTHGIAAGDYDADGLVDLVVSVGGGNGMNPRPPRMLRNTGTGFEDVTEGSGIENLGARGRSVRWIDLDTDGDLDLLSINAQQLPGETGPRNILFEHTGGGTFVYRDSGGFEDLEAERVLITDFNNDHVPDLVTFEPLELLQGTNEFRFENVTAEWLPGVSDEQRHNAMAVAEADIDNDGDMDLYVARGKTYYQIANNALELNAETGRMDLRDEGNESEDGVTFSAGNSVTLRDFWHWPRGVDLFLPVYLGETKNPIDTPAEPVEVTASEAIGFPAEITDNGWYLGQIADGKWRLAWKLNGNLAWDVRASVIGVTDIEPDWEPATLGKADLLLVNEGTHFRNEAAALPDESDDNNWGVITGDFDNDADADFFIYRFGRLHGRVEDLLLVNDGSGSFTASTEHGANNVAAGGHGDMGAPFDYDGDGWLDILSGSDNYGYWHLYRNTTGDAGAENRSLSIHVGNSPEGTDAHAALVELSTDSGTQLKRVGSRGAVHSQSFTEFVHFGIGVHETADVRVRWRDGVEVELDGLAAGQTHTIGSVSEQLAGQP